MVILEKLFERSLAHQQSSEKKTADADVRLI